MTTNQKRKTLHIVKLAHEISDKSFEEIYLFECFKEDLSLLIERDLLPRFGTLTSFEKRFDLYHFDNGNSACRLVCTEEVKPSVAKYLQEKNLVKTINKANLDYQEHSTLSSTTTLEQHSKIHTHSRKLFKMSGRLHIKNFRSCLRCSTSILNGKPYNFDPQWNSAHLYSAMAAEEQSFKVIHGFDLKDELNISWGIPKEEVVKGSGRCEFCEAYCSAERFIVSMVAII